MHNLSCVGWALSALFIHLLVSFKNHMKSDRFKGYFFAILGTVAFSNEYIFSKAALNQVHLAQFGLYWFLISTIAMLLYMMFQKKLQW
jgi:hypothetical protein